MLGAIATIIAATPALSLAIWGARVSYLNIKAVALRSYADYLRAR